MVLTIVRSLQQFCLIGLSTISLSGVYGLGIAQEIAELPPAPSRGTPKGTSSAGGTRSEPDLNQGCNSSNQSLVYLLDSGIRDFTLAAYPVFWFYNPDTTEEIAYLEFTLAETQTAKTIYRAAVNPQERAGIMGITLPREEQYALELDKDYSWSLRVYCHQEQNEPNLVLEGWLRRLPLTSSLKKQLAASPTQQYAVYRENNILYDTLTNLAQLRQHQPNDPEIMQAWNQLLTDLGWQELAQKPIVEALLYSAED